MARRGWLICWMQCYDVVCIEEPWVETSSVHATWSIYPEGATGIFVRHRLHASVLIRSIRCSMTMVVYGPKTQYLWRLRRLKIYFSHHLLTSYSSVCAWAHFYRTFSAVLLCSCSDSGNHCSTRSVMSSVTAKFLQGFASRPFTIINPLSSSCRCQECWPIAGLFSVAGSSIPIVIGSVNDSKLYCRS